MEMVLRIIWYGLLLLFGSAISVVVLLGVQMIIVAGLAESDRIARQFRKGD